MNRVGWGGRGYIIKLLKPSHNFRKKGSVLGIDDIFHNHTQLFSMPLRKEQTDLGSKMTQPSLENCPGNCKVKTTPGIGSCFEGSESK